MLRAAEVVADLEDDKVPADEHVVEIVRVDPEQDRGHSIGSRIQKKGLDRLDTMHFMSKICAISFFNSPSNFSFP